jgi:hypothetical protein
MLPQDLGEFNGIVGMDADGRYQCPMDREEVNGVTFHFVVRHLRVTLNHVRWDRMLTLLAILNFHVAKTVIKTPADRTDCQGGMSSPSK